jgi:hypothetical protein
MAEDALILHPTDPQFAPADAALYAALAAVGVVGAALPALGPCHFRPGPDFLQRIVFLGCSPVVALGEPGATGASYCRIELTAALARPALVHGANVRQPRCPGCKAPVPDWDRHLPRWEAEPLTEWSCPGCGHAAPAAGLRWRQGAAAMRRQIRVWGIFEGEAVPDERLLAVLLDLGGGPWEHIYARL